MSALKLKLNRNLRRQVLRGHPWIYKQALADVPSQKEATLARVSDHQGEFLCWAIFDPNSPLALRVLTTTRDFSEQIIQQKLEAAFALRQRLGSKNTNCFRLINGEGDFLPGLVCDFYGPAAVIQYDGAGPEAFWQSFPISKSVLEHTGAETVYIKPRGKEGKLRKVVGTSTETIPIVKENSCSFKVDLECGQKTGFFLDQRDNRKSIVNHVANKSVINLFSYTGGFSIYAGVGGAAKVVSADISEKALALAQENWRLNHLDEDKHQCLQADIFKYLTEDKTKFDMVIVDPPSMAPSESAKAAATQKYTELFTAAAKKVNPGGDLVLSSCSSHISFNDFSEIATEAISKARRRGQVCRISGQGFDHPFPLACPELSYLKFFHLKLD